MAWMVCTILCSNVMKVKFTYTVTRSNPNRHLFEGTHKLLILIYIFLKNGYFVGQRCMVIWGSSLGTDDIPGFFETALLRLFVSLFLNLFQVPYHDLHYLTIAYTVAVKGSTLPIPPDCPQLFSSTMRSCWVDSNARITFPDLLQTFVLHKV